MEYHKNLIHMHMKALRDYYCCLSVVLWDFILKYSTNILTLDKKYLRFLLCHCCFFFFFASISFIKLLRLSNLRFSSLLVSLSDIR